MEQDGRKLSKEARQERRNTIVRMRRAGGKEAITIRESGREPGENRRLAPEQEQRIRKLIIDRCPDQLKLDVAL